MMDEASADLPTAPLAALCAGNPLVGWLWEKGWTLPTLGELTQGLGRAMNVAGIPVMRLRVTLRTMHPQLAGLSYTWRRDTDEVEKFWPPLTVLQQDMFLKSPYALIFEGAGAVRRRLDIPEAAHDFPILEELGAMGATDYVALPLVFEDGRIHAMTIARINPAASRPRSSKRWRRRSRCSPGCWSCTRCDAPRAPCSTPISANSPASGSGRG
ncbi:MAG: hypothetical protein IPK78_15240 [Rhodospirillales bacterium]|nr:hypothetical protein [Rhodospirillales bacterium]